MEEREINLASMLALCVRKGKKVLICMLVLGLLLGAHQTVKRYHALKENAAKALNVETLNGVDDWMSQAREKLAEDDALLTADYEESKANFDIQMDSTRLLIENQRSYIEDSLLMKIDPYNEYVTNVFFDLKIDDLSAFEQSFGQDITPMDYLVSKVLNQYRAAWNRVDLAEEFGLDDTTDKYLREVVSVQIDGGNSVITVRAIGRTAEESQELSELACHFLLSQHNSIEDVSYRHTITRIGEGTQTLVNTDLAERQENAYTRLEDYKEAYDTLREEADNLKAPTLSSSSGVKSIVKGTVLGCVLGLILACCWIVGKSLLGGAMDDPLALEREQKLLMLGALPHRRKLFDRWADKLLNNRVWESEEQALAYIAQKAELQLGQREKILLLSTLPGESDSTIQELSRALAGAGREVAFADDFVHNPKAIEALRRCDGVVLAEKCGVSRLTVIQDMLATVKGAGKPVDGYILL